MADTSARLRTLWVPAVLVTGATAASLLLGSGRQGGAKEDDRRSSAEGPAPAIDMDYRGPLHVEQEIRAVLTDLIATAAAWLVRFDVAVQPELVIRADRRSFREALAAMANHAAGQAPDGRVLITAARRGGRVQISVTDGGAGADRVGVAAALRDTESLIAMQGGTFEIVARPAEGTTLVARWPDAPRDAKPQKLAAPPPDAAVRSSSSTHSSHSAFSN